MKFIDEVSIDVKAAMAEMVLQALDVLRIFQRVDQMAEMVVTEEVSSLESVNNLNTLSNLDFKENLKLKMANEEEVKKNWIRW